MGNMALVVPVRNSVDFTEHDVFKAPATFAKGLRPPETRFAGKSRKKFFVKHNPSHISAALLLEDISCQSPMPHLTPDASSGHSIHSDNSQSAIPNAALHRPPNLSFQPSY